MYWIGQRHIMRELKVILPKAQVDKTFNPKILLKAQSGFGKTKLGFEMIKFIARDSFQYLIAEDGIEEKLDLRKRVIFVDEIHLLKTPEVLYPLLDDKNHFVILASNESGELKEPLVNRCIVFVFTAYENNELIEISRNALGDVHVYFTDSMIEYLINTSNRNPRVLIGILNRIITLCSVNGFPRNINELKEIIETILNIKDGLDVQAQKYLEVLSKLGNASLNVLINLTGIDKTTITFQIEPVLLYKKFISISSRGRKYETSND